jgi:Phosphate-selective porin O and P
VNNVKKLRKLRLIGAAILLGSTASSYGGAKIAIDDTKWVSVGAGLRTAFTAVEDAAPSGNDYSNDFSVQNMRLYLSGQIHDKIKMTFNTDCVDCGSGGDMFVLDAIAQFEFSPAINVWAGRMLTPADRIEMNGPFYGLSWNQYTVPLFPSDQADNAAGKFGRDDGVTFWGTVGKFQYAVGAFDGYNGESNQEDSLLYAARFAYNFLNMEDNPGYYTSSTYFGGAGDILTVALSAQFQNDGVGTQSDPEDFTGYVVDALFEKVLAGGSVLTVEGEYKVFDLDLSDTASADPGCFCLFDGDSYFVTGAYLFPQDVGFGKFQPYLRYTENSPDNDSDSDLTEIGVNYVIKSHNARLNFNFTTGDANSTGLPGPDVEAFSIGAQVQL